MKPQGKDRNLSSFLLYRFYMGQADSDNVFKVIKIFYTLAQLDGEALSKDDSLIILWNKLHLNIIPQEKEIYLFVPESIIF